MKILSWFKNKIKILLSLFKKKIANDQKTPFSVLNTKDSVKTSGPYVDLSVETKVVDLLVDLQKKKSEMDKALEEFTKEKTTITTLKDDAKNILIKSENTQNLVFLGFVVLIAMFATLALAHLDLIRSGLEKDQEINSIKQESDMKIFKNCLSISKWLNPKCFEN